MTTKTRSIALLMTLSLLAPGAALAGRTDTTVPQMMATPYTQAELCAAVAADLGFRAVVKDALEGGVLVAADAQLITQKVCEFHTSSPALQQQLWSAALTKAVAAGFLTNADKLALQPILVNPGAIAQWSPQTAFGHFIQDGAEEQASKSNSGVGFVVGAIIGGAIGFGAAGPGGVGPGIAIGGAAGNLAETLVNSGEGEGEEGGEDGGDDGGGDGGDA